MNRTRCPNCNTRLDDPLLIACPACGVIFTQHRHFHLELVEQQKELLTNEIAERVKSSMERFAQDKNELVNEVARLTRSRLRWELIAGVLFLLTVAGYGIWQAYELSLKSAANFISDKIATQFAEPTIKETLNTVARTRASEIIEEQVRPSVEAVQHATAKTLQSFENSLADTKAKLDKVGDEIQLITEFSMTVVAAQNDDRKAFDKLQIWIGDNSYPFSSLATTVWWNVVDEHEMQIHIGGLIFPWHEGLDPSKVTLEEFQEGYKEIPSSLKLSLIEYVWKREDIPKKDRMQFLIDVMENDQSLRAVDCAGRFFRTAAELKIKSLLVGHFVDWWKNNKDKFE